MINFEEYKKLGEPEKKEKSEIWEAAIGLQQVDGLKPSKYLIETAKANIEGDITVDEVKQRIYSYYSEKPTNIINDNSTEEADKVSAHIAEILSEKTFVFNPAEYLSIHKRLFEGIYEHAGKIRNYNISKNEWVLNGETVLYASASNIKATLDYDFAQEKNFHYKGLSKRQMVEHFVQFVSNIWQIHAFAEGNTRTTAVFAIKYLRSLGFNINNDLFAEHSWYFRNALVRANYTNYDLNIYSTFKFLHRFFGNLLLGENNILRNRDMHIKNDTDENSSGTVNAKNDTVTGTINQQSGTVKYNVLNLIQENSRITAEQISQKLGVSLRTAKRRIKELKDNNKIIRVGSDKSGYWKILK